MTSRSRTRCRGRCGCGPLRLAIAGLAALSAAADRRAPPAAAANARSRRLRRAPPASRSWPSFRCATSGSPSTTPTAGSCGRRCRAARRDARRPPAASASCRRMRSITRTCMTMPTCRTCSASPGRASRCTAASLPGYPASHGCVRLPFDFAERLFGATRLGMRVIVTPSDVTPVEIAHPALFRSKPRAAALVAALAAEAEAAARKADQARSPPSQPPARPRRRWCACAWRKICSAGPRRNWRRRRPPSLRNLGRGQGAGRGGQGEGHRQDDRIAAQWVAAKAEAAAEARGRPPLREAAVTLEKARALPPRRRARRRASSSPYRCSSAARARASMSGGHSARAGESGHDPDPDRPIGTHVFTALARTTATPDAMERRFARRRTSARRRGRPRERTRGIRGRDVEPITTNPDSAKAALDQIVIPQEHWIVSPEWRAPIVTDHHGRGVSSETGKETEFVVVLSGEPQGGLKMRRRNPGNEFRYARQRGQVSNSLSEVPFSTGEPPFFVRSPPQ